MKVLLLSIFLIGSLFAGTYDYNYSLKDSSIVSKKDKFMYGDFSEIIRFDMLNFKDNHLKSGEDKKLQKIENTIKKYIDNNKSILITIIGHTNEPTDDYNEVLFDSKTYANKIQNVFRPTLTEKTTLRLSKQYALDIESRLIDADINKSLMTVEYRGGKDMAFSDATTNGKELSNRVMVTMYVYPEKELDGDGDGVIDGKDSCLNTIKGVTVDKKGCPLDDDNDGVSNYKDTCSNTPDGIKVDKKGCPFDSDNDGVADYKDSCSNTVKGLMVDPKGCSRNKNLELCFQTGSDIILKKSYKKVKEFAKFMKENPAYNAEIIGHTDSQGNESKNMKLSEARANSAKLALVDAGVEASRLTTLGRGELDPLQTNRTEAGRKANRRIEVKLSLRK